MKPRALIKRFRIDRPDRFRLAEHDPGETAGFAKEDAEELADAQSERMTDLQQRLYAEHTWALLVILQGVDAAGKDSAIRRVTAGLNPQGCIVHPFKQPNDEELDHGFLWRAVKWLPPRGDIGIFNRSYYEDVLAVRAHRELLGKQRLPRQLITPRIWQERFEDINAFERNLLRNGTAVLKFHLHISKDEQKKRLMARLDEPNKFWKASMSDVADRRLWPRLMAAYQDMIRHTSTPEAPWHCVPADHKWFARLLITTAIADTLERLRVDYPKPDRARLRELKQIRKALKKT